MLKNSIARQLLSRPMSIFEEIAKERHAPTLFWSMLVVGLLAFFVYGFVAGTFVSEWQHWFKIGGKSLVLAYGAGFLSLSSLYVFLSLQGSYLSLRQLILLLTGKIATMGIVLVGLLPITWFFTFASLSPEFAEGMHVLAWLLATLFGYIFLFRGVHNIIKKEDSSKNVTLLSFILLIWGGVYLLVVGRLLWLLQPFFENYEGFLK